MCAIPSPDERAPAALATLFHAMVPLLIREGSQRQILDVAETFQTMTRHGATHGIDAGQLAAALRPALSVKIESHTLKKVLCRDAIGLIDACGTSSPELAKIRECLDKMGNAVVENG
eukprot:Polyplicarium_translucidae@DN1168_c0_g1_i1.p1